MSILLGKNNPSYKHGFSGKHPLYKVWINMKNRCYNFNNIHFKNYGGRGIIVCENWKFDFKSFCEWALANGFQTGLTIDRKDNNLGYFPENCRFVDYVIQGRNQRLRFNSESGLKGVTRKDYGNGKYKWRVRITVNKTTKQLGCFDSADEAYNARTRYILDNNLSDFII